MNNNAVHCLLRLALVCSDKDELFGRYLRQSEKMRRQRREVL